MQRGKIFRKGTSWHLRYKTYRIADGKKVWQTTSTKLADVDQLHRTQQSVEQEAEKFLKANEHGDELYPTKWNHDFMDMPGSLAESSAGHHSPVIK